MDESGLFTDHGYVRMNGGRFVEIYNGSIEDIPEEYRITRNAPPVRVGVGKAEQNQEVER